MTRLLLPTLLLGGALVAADGGAPLPSGDLAGGPAPGGAAAHPAQELPAGVTPEMVRRGREIYMGQGYCHGCHGPEGKGIPNLGSDLTDDEWSHSDGSYGGLVERIRRGVPAEAAAAGVPMPPAGGGGLDREDVRAVAAYVWTLSAPEDG